MFSIVDSLGGKNSINAESIEKFLAVRGVLEPKNESAELIKQGKKERELHNFVTQAAVCAGPQFSLDTQMLESMNQRVEEMDRVEIVELEPSTFKY